MGIRLDESGMKAMESVLKKSRFVTVKCKFILSGKRTMDAAFQWMLYSNGCCIPMDAVFIRRRL